MLDKAGRVKISSVVGRFSGGFGGYFAGIIRRQRCVLDCTLHSLGHRSVKALGVEESGAVVHATVHEVLPLCATVGLSSCLGNHALQILDVSYDLLLEGASSWDILHVRLR